MNTLEIGKRVINTEAQALLHVVEQLDDTFDAFVDAFEKCQGKVIFIGMGKSGHVASKMAATMSSLGTCAIQIHPAECMHGDLGMIQKQDIVVLISYSGESDEIKGIIPGIRRIGAKMMGITFNANSTLVKNVSICQVFDKIDEACHLGLAPTTSTTIVMAYGDAIAIAIAESRGFAQDDFGAFHPAGSLGKRLIIRGVDLMIPVRAKYILNKESTILDAITAMTETGLDVIMVSDDRGHLSGIISNGEIQRLIESGAQVMGPVVPNIKKKYPIFIDSSAKAVEALQCMEENELHVLPIVNEEKVLGVIRKEDILKAGITL